MRETLYRVLLKRDSGDFDRSLRVFTGCVPLHEARDQVGRPS